MVRIRLSLVFLLAALVAAPVGAGPSMFGSKPKPDAARVRALIETLKSDPDEKKRKAAATELGWADGRLLTDVAPALAVALQKDAAAGVRAEAAEALGQLNQMAPMAGMALETAAASDVSPAVRLAAKKALWEYHLHGYHSPRTADGLPTQTVEPPIASPAGPQVVVAYTPAPPPPVYIAPLPTESLTSPSQLPQVAPPNGPRVAWPPLFGALLPRPQTVIHTLTGATPPPILNVTSEPPIAKATVSIPSRPTPTTAEPPLASVKPPVPDYDPTLPPFMPELPSVVLPPDATPIDPVPAPPKIPATLPPLPR